MGKTFKDRKKNSNHHQFDSQPSYANPKKQKNKPRTWSRDKTEDQLLLELSQINQFDLLAKKPGQ